MSAAALLLALAVLAIGIAAALITGLLPTLRAQLAALALVAVCLPLGAVLASGLVMFKMQDYEKVVAVSVISAAFGPRRGATAGTTHSRASGPTSRGLGTSRAWRPERAGSRIGPAGAARAERVLQRDGREPRAPLRRPARAGRLGEPRPSHTDRRALRDGRGARGRPRDAGRVRARHPRADRDPLERWSRISSSWRGSTRARFASSLQETSLGGLVSYCWRRSGPRRERTTSASGAARSARPSGEGRAGQGAARPAEPTVERSPARPAARRGRRDRRDRHRPRRRRGGGRRQRSRARGVAANVRSVLARRPVPEPLERRSGSRARDRAGARPAPTAGRSGRRTAPAAAPASRSRFRSRTLLARG